MTELTMGYSDSEDRLWLVLSDNDSQFWLSRRFCANLLTGLASELSISCAGLVYGPQTDPDLRVALEHETAHEHAAQLRQDALEQPPESQTAQANADSAPRTRVARLLTSIKITTTSSHVQMDLITSQVSRSLHLNRAEAHQVLSSLWLHSQAAGWGLTVPSWVQKPALN